MNAETRPTYIKVNRKYLLPETLKEFNLPWEWDESDRDYVIIKQNLSQDLQDALFEHSRRIMERKRRARDVGRKSFDDDDTDDYSDMDDDVTEDDLFGFRAALLVDLEDQIFLGPGERKKGPYVSFSVLSPVITVENQQDELLIAARFNIETTILGYASNKGDGHEMFFHDICLQYLSSSPKEDLLMKPESDPSSSLVVTKSTNTQINPQASLSLSQSPSANVSIGLTRSSGLSVQYSVNSWYVSAHRIVNEQDESHGSKSTKQQPRAQSSQSKEELPRYQWFWAGTHEDTRKLTPDLKHTITRHVVVKRKLPLLGFPFGDTKQTMNPDTHTEHVFPKPGVQDHAQRRTRGTKPGDKNSYYERLLQALQHHFTFKFSAQVRVKRRYGRVHRLLILSGNEVKGKFLNPVYTVDFTLQPPSNWFDELIKDGCHPNAGSESTETSEKKHATEESAEVISAGDGQDGRELYKEDPGEGNSGEFIFPLGPTVDVESMLEKLKDKVRSPLRIMVHMLIVIENAGKWDRIQARRLKDITGDSPVMDMREKKKASEFYERVESMKQQIIKVKQQDMERMETSEKNRETESKIPDLPPLEEQRHVFRRVDD